MHHLMNPRESLTHYNPKNTLQFYTHFTIIPHTILPIFYGGFFSTLGSIVLLTCDPVYLNISIGSILQILFNNIWAVVFICVFDYTEKMKLIESSKYSKER